MEAVLSTLQENYVRPDEANAAQSRVAMKGKHKFIDKVHVRYVEKEKRHWASLENFASQRIAIGEKFYRDNDRLLEGGIWAEVVIAHNDIDADNICLLCGGPAARSSSADSTLAAMREAQKTFSRDEWMDVVLRSVGLEPTKLSTAGEVSLYRQAGAAGGAEFQLHRTWSARHGKVLLLSANSHPTRRSSVAARRPSQCCSTTMLAAKSAWWGFGIRLLSMRSAGSRSRIPTPSRS